MGCGGATACKETGLGLYDYVARRYDPVLGRFIQADTTVPEPGNPQSLNRYTYVLGAPLRYTDPQGHWWEDPETGALLPGYSPKSLPDSWKAGRRNYIDIPAPQPYFERLPIAPTREATSQWFGATNFAHNYGYLWNYDGYCQGMHCGIDIGRVDSEYGTPVFAGLYGTVASITPAFGAGPYAVNVRIGSYVVVYGHLDGDIRVKAGAVVNPETILAGVGNPSGAADLGNVHLHLEVRYRNELIYNPLLFMGEAEYRALTTVMDPFDFYYTGKWATPFDQPVVVRGGQSLWSE